MRRPEAPGPPPPPASRWECRFATNPRARLSRPRPRCGQRSPSSGARCSFRSPRSSGGRSASDGGDRRSPDMAQRESEDAARLLERLLADRTLRERFRRDPAGVSREAGLERVAEELRVRDGKALDTPDGRESRSSLAGVLRAAAIEGAGIFDFSPHVAGHVERVPEPVERVLASHRDHAGAGAVGPAASHAAALPEPLHAPGTTPAPPSAAGEFRAITPREAAAAAAKGPRPTGAAPEPVPIDVAREAPAGDGANPARLDAGLEHGPSDAPELPGDDEEAPDGASGGEEGPDDDGDGSDDGDDSDSDDASDDEEDDENEGGEAPDADDGSSGEGDDSSDNPDGDHDDNSDATDGDNSDSDNSDSDSDNSDSDSDDGGAIDVAPGPASYPGDDAPQGHIAAWMAREAQTRGLPPELPVMAALVESGMRNLTGGDRDSLGFFQMRHGIWN